MDEELKKSGESEDKNDEFIDTTILLDTQFSKTYEI